MSFQCWSCGAPLTGMILPVSRREECSSCRAEIHCCRMCVHYDVTARRCREDRAEDVASRETANFCDWFKPSENAFAKPADKDPSAELRALFGEDDADPDTDAAKRPKNPLDDLFR